MSDEEREHPLVAELKHRLAYADDLDNPYAGSSEVEATVRKINILLLAYPSREGQS